MTKDNSSSLTRAGTTLTRIKRLFLLVVIVGAVPLTTQSETTESTGQLAEGLAPGDFANLSLEELMNIEVTSVSKKKEKLSQAPAAIFVVTQTDIRRSGATSIPEVLRMVPGLQVARMDGNKWAITARGFNGRFANKLLVMIDGRSVYTPLFSGVFWEIQDTLLEDIDRIEVIRGPGGTLWGANAVNGVINIVTKNAEDTQGTFLSATSGTEEKGSIEGRFGAKIGEKIAYRIYGKAFERDEQVVNDRVDGHDDWRMGRGGFRADAALDSRNRLTLQGDYYNGDAGQEVFLPLSSQGIVEDASVSGGNLLLRWQRTLDEDSDLALQIYYDRTSRDELIIDEDRDTVDIDFQYRFQPLHSHEIIWGAGYRLTADDFKTVAPYSVSQNSRNDELFSTFVQDKITVIPDRLWLTIGTKFEKNDFTDSEIQPSARFTYTPRPRQTIWGAVSRAVRTPFRLEHTLRFPQDVPIAGVDGDLRADDRFDSEEMVGYELGYRVQPSDRLSIDVTAFLNLYDELQTVEIDGPVDFSDPLNPRLPLAAGNKMDAETYGAELVLRLGITDWWTLQGQYSYLDLQAHVDNSSDDQGREEIWEIDIPQHQFSVQSSMDLGTRLSFDAWLRYVDIVTGINSYTTLDVRLEWKATENIEIAVVGQNLLERHRREYVPSTVLNSQITEIERAVYGKISCRF